MRISDWSSDVCSSDLVALRFERGRKREGTQRLALSLQPRLLGRQGHVLPFQHSVQRLGFEVIETHQQLARADAIALADAQLGDGPAFEVLQDRKSTRLNSSP